MYSQTASSAPPEHTDDLHRADLVPVYSFGENELFQQVIFPEGSMGRRLQDLFKKIMGFAPCLFVGERMAFLPYKIPITTVGEFCHHPGSYDLCDLPFFCCCFYTNTLLASSSGKSNFSTQACHTHRGGGGPLSQTLHGGPVQVIP